MHLSIFFSNYPLAENQYMQEPKSWGIHFLCEYMRGLCSHSRECRKIFLRDHFPHISSFLDGLHFGANTCRACTRIRANTGKKSWRIIYVLVSCQGAITPKLRLHLHFLIFCNSFPECNSSLRCARQGAFPLSHYL